MQLTPFSREPLEARERQLGHWHGWEKDGQTLASLSAARWAYMCWWMLTFRILVARGRAFREEETLGRATILAPEFWPDIIERRVSETYICAEAGAEKENPSRQHDLYMTRMGTHNAWQGPSEISHLPFSISCHTCYTERVTPPLLANGNTLSPDLIRLPAEPPPPKEEIPVDDFIVDMLPEHCRTHGDGCSLGHLRLSIAEWTDRSSVLLLQEDKKTYEDPEATKTTAAF